MNNRAIMWAAIVLILMCGVLQIINYFLPGLILGVIGIILIIYALATGKVKTFG